MKAEDLYRRLLRLYPRALREAWGEEMVALFRDGLEAARRQGGGRAGLRFWARMAADLVRQAGAARLEALAGRTENSARTTTMETLGQDLRTALRGFARAPGFAAVALVTLAVGIGANSAIFSIYDAALLDELPYGDADRIVVPYNLPRGQGGGFAAGSQPLLASLEEAGPFEAVAGFAPTRVNVGGADRPEQVPAVVATAPFFDVVGVRPALGRGFLPGDGVPGAAPVVVLGHGLWTRRFGGDPGVVGRTVVVDGVPSEVVGVMPAGFRFVFEDAELWRPIRLDRAAFDRTDALNNNRVFAARLPEGLSLDAAEARLPVALEHFRGAFPEATSGEHRLRLVPLREHLYGHARRELRLLMGAVVLVLLIACANLANLLLARAESRRQELAVRAALGARRGRLVRQLVTESVVLAAAGGALGVALAWLGVRAIRPLAPAGLPLDGAVLDGRVLVFTTALALATGVVFGLVPAAGLRASGLRSGLAAGGRSGPGGRLGARRALVAGEVALAAVLLVASGLLLNTLSRLGSVDPGFDARDRWSASFELPGARYDEAEARAFHRRLEERLRALPGVEAAAVVQFVPLSGATPNWGYEAEGVDGVRTADYNLVSPGWFDAVGIDFVRGSAPAWSDAEGGRPVVVVSRSLAESRWPGEDPIGKRVNVNIDGRVWREVVGVVEDVRNRGLDQEPTEQMYFLPARYPFSNPLAMSVVVREAGGAVSAGALRRVVAELDPAVPVARIRTLEGWSARSEGRRRFLLALVGLFAATALLLSCVGLYGVVAWTFARRTREIGLRMALGASAGTVLGMVLRQGAVMVLVGLGIGLAAAAGASRLLAGLLYGVRPVDPATYASVALLLASVAAVATWLPARRAAKVPPTVALRVD